MVLTIWESSGIVGGDVRSGGSCTPSSHRAAAHKAMGEALQILQSAPIAPLNGMHPQHLAQPSELEGGWHICVVKSLPKQSLAEINKKQAQT